MEDEFEKLSEEVVSYAGGLPLALTVLGAFLCDKNVGQWRSALDRLKEIPHKDIIGILRISFNGLEEVEKKLFLDIACFFRWKDTVQAMKKLDACGFHSAIGTEVLRQKALIDITYNGKFDMHDLVQEMGHHIVRGEHPNNPEKHSRVWRRKDVDRIISMATTMKLDNIEAIDLPEYVSYEEAKLILQVAGNMNKLRWIDLNCGGMNNEPRDGNIVPWPESIPPPQLCYLDLRGRFPQKQLWEGYKYLPNLTHMELDDMPNLIKIPDFAGLPNLETFKLLNCPSLKEIHPSIGRLESLLFIFIYGCGSLRKFPSITRIKKLETLELIKCHKLKIISEEMHNSGKEVASCSSPHNNSNHRQLQFSHSALRKLVFSSCRLGDEEISSAVWDLPNLEELDLYDNRFSRLDFSKLRLPRLKWLDVSECKGLIEMTELPSTIAVVIADYCESLESFGDISNCKWLWKVSLLGENKFDQLHGDTLIHSMLQGKAGENHFFSVLQHQYPSRFVGRLFGRNKFRMHLPDDWYNDFCGFLICIVSRLYLPAEVKIKIGQEESPFDLLQESDAAVEPPYESDDDSDESDDDKKTCVGYVSFSSLRHPTLLTSSYNTISFTLDECEFGLDLIDYESFYVGVELIPRKSKSDEVRTTDSSELWDKKDDYEYSTFTIQQCDSESSIEITWRPENS